MEIKTSWGSITLTLDGDAVVGCALPILKEAPPHPFTLGEYRDVNHLLQTFSILGTLHGTPFQQAVWTAIRAIPFGHTKSYGELARAIGCPTAVRAVGTACGANPVPLFIPCHRVVAQNGLGGYGYGIPWKTMLLAAEAQ